MHMYLLIRTHSLRKQAENSIYVFLTEKKKRTCNYMYSKMII